MEFGDFKPQSQNMSNLGSKHLAKTQKNAKYPSLSNISADTMINNIFKNDQLSLQPSSLNHNKPQLSSNIESSQKGSANSLSISDYSQALNETKVYTTLELPLWLTDASVTPSVYSKAFSLVQSEGNWVDTNRASLLLLQTGVSPQILGVLWEQVNQTQPGRLIVSEFYALLAMIACFQKGIPCHSVKALLHLGEPIVPFISHPALMMDAPTVSSDATKVNEYVKQNHLINSYEFSTHSKLQETILCPASISNESVVPSNTLISYSETPTTSLNCHTEDDFDEFQSAPTPISSDCNSYINPDVGFNSMFAPVPQSSNPILSSEQTDVFEIPIQSDTSFVSMTQSVDIGITSLAYGDSISTNMNQSDSSLSKSWNTSSNIQKSQEFVVPMDDKYAALREPSLTEENPLKNDVFDIINEDNTEFGEFCSVLQSNTDQEYEVNSLSIVSSNSKEGKPSRILDASSLSSLIYSNTLGTTDDDFGNFIGPTNSEHLPSNSKDINFPCSSEQCVPTAEVVDNSNKYSDLSSGIDNILGLSSRNSLENDFNSSLTVNDQCKSVNEGFENDTQELQTSLWVKCLEGCLRLMKEGSDLMEEFVKNPLLFDQLLKTSQSTDYFLSLKEVQNVNKRISGSNQRGYFFNSVKELSDNISHLWTSLLNSLPQNLLKIIESSDGFTKLNTEETGAKCCICLRGEEVDLVYGRNSYHASCANLWINVVDLTLPSRVKYKITSV